MNLRDLSEAAVVVSWYGLEFPSQQKPTTSNTLAEFWKYVSFLEHAWKKELRNHAETSKASSRLYEEILVCELLIRTTIVSLDLFQQSRATSSRFQFRSLKRLEQHTDFVADLLDQCCLATDTCAELMRMQRFQEKLERWTDLMLSRADHHEQTAAYAIDVVRYRQFQQEHADQANQHESLVFSLQMTALRRNIPDRLIGHPLRVAVYKILIAQAVSLVEESSFRSDGHLKSYLARRIDASRSGADSSFLGTSFLDRMKPQPFPFT